jgi:cell division protein ZapA
MAEKDRQIQGVVVSIYGDQYRIASDGNRAEVEQVAAYVDQKMRQIAAHAHRLPKTTLAVLAAMDITAELLGARQEQEQLAGKAQESLGRMSKLIDERASIFSAHAQRPSSPLERLLREQPAGEADPPAQP